MDQDKSKLLETYSGYSLNGLKTDAHNSKLLNMCQDKEKNTLN